MCFHHKTFVVVLFYFIHHIENFIDKTETNGLENRMINIIINLQTLEIPGKRVSLRDYLSQHGIYSYLWKTVLITLTDVGIPRPF